MSRRNSVGLDTFFSAASNCAERIPITPISHKTASSTSYRASRGSDTLATAQIANPSLTEYWTASQWLDIFSTGKVNALDAVEALGLAYSRRSLRAVPMFDTKVLKELYSRITKIATESLSQLQEGALAEAAADPNYAEYSIQVLLEDFGSRIWERDTDRSMMMQVRDGPSLVHRKHLIYEEEKDRKWICLHLHQWIFLKAYTDSWYMRVLSMKMTTDSIKKSSGSGSLLKGQVGTGVEYDEGAFFGGIRTQDKDYALKSPESVVSFVHPTPHLPIPEGLTPATTPGSSSKRRVSNMFEDVLGPQIGVLQAEDEASFATYDQDVGNFDQCPLTKYWDESSWKIMSYQSRVHLSTILSCLGIKATGRSRGRFQFQHELTRWLEDEVSQIATKVWLNHGKAELIKAATDPYSLDEDIDSLLYDFVAGLWGQDADREHLLKPGENDTYPKHLEFENDEDREMIWLHLHRWIFAKAFNMLRSRGSTSTLKQRKLIAQRKLSTHRPPLKPHKLRSTFDKNPTNTQHETSYEGWKRKTCVPQFKPAVRRSVLVDLFVDYLFNMEEKNLDESTLLHDMEIEWSTGQKWYSLILDDDLVDSFSIVFPAWIKYRRDIMSIKEQFSEVVPFSQSNAANDFDPLSVLDAKIRRSRLLTELRKSRDVFMKMRIARDADHPEALFGIVFRLLQGSDDMGGMLELVYDGLEGLDEKLVKSVGGERWVVLGY